MLTDVLMDTLINTFGRDYRAQRLEAFLRLPEKRERQRLLNELKAKAPVEAENRLTAWTGEHGLSTECHEKLRKHLAPIIEAPSGADETIKGFRFVSDFFLRQTLADEGLGRRRREDLLSRWTPWEEQLFRDREDAKDLPDDAWGRRMEELDRNDAEIWRERLSDIAWEIVTAQIIEPRIPPQPHLGTLCHGMRAFGGG